MAMIPETGTLRGVYPGSASAVRHAPGVSRSCTVVDCPFFWGLTLAEAQKIRAAANRKLGK